LSYPRTAGRGDWTRTSDLLVPNRLEEYPVKLQQNIGTARIYKRSRITISGGVRCERKNPHSGKNVWYR